MAAFRFEYSTLEPYFHFCDWRAKTGRERERDGRHIGLFQCNFLIIFYADFLHQAFRTRESIIKTITEVFVFFLSSQKCHRRARFVLALIYTPLWRYAIQACSAGDGRRYLSVLRKFLQSASPFQRNLIKTYLSYQESRHKESTKHIHT